MPASSGLEDLKILLIDDDDTMRTLLRRMLSRMKVSNISEANGGREALERIAEPATPIDLVICDWNMPEMTGIEIFARARTLRPQIPFLMLTGRADIDSIIAAKTAGIAAYIVKPIAAQELKAKIAFLASFRRAPRPTPVGQAALRSNAA
jgi:two-component system chemotaxis response regulator CheY